MPLKTDYRPGQTLNAVPSADMRKIATVIDTLRGIGIDIRITESGRGSTLTVKVDDTTIELDPTTKKLKIVAGGVGTTELEDASVTNAKIGTNAVKSSNINGGEIQTGHMVSSYYTGSLVIPPYTLNYTNGILTSVS